VLRISKGKTKLDRSGKKTKEKGDRGRGVNTRKLREERKVREYGGNARGEKTGGRGWGPTMMEV